VDRSRIAHNHRGGDTCLDADGCDIGYGPEWACARAGAGTRGCRRGARSYEGGGYK
jgi:hypothetical protein